jgi:alpha-beta hydrolase superfamily lysophospholipase
VKTKRDEVAAEVRRDVLAECLDQEAPATGAPFTKIPDSAMLCEGITSTAFLLWCVLRSMQFEPGRGPGIPPLTLDQVCWLLPGVKGKPTSRTRARDALDCLIGVGLLRDVSPAGTAKSAPRFYEALDEPEQPVPWRGARHKLFSYRPVWRKGRSVDEGKRKL